MKVAIVGSRRYENKKKIKDFEFIGDKIIKGIVENNISK